MGRVDGIWVKRVRGGPMDAVEVARLVAGRGIEGNANQGGRRQVTLLEREVWERVTGELGVDVDPSARRANILVRGISLADTRDRVLRIGACRVRVRGETKPCRMLDEVSPGLQAALYPAWRGGAFGEVLDSGEIRLGDGVSFDEPGPTDAAPSER